MQRISNLKQIEYIVKNQLLIFKQDGSLAFSAGDLLNMTLSEILYTVIDNFYYEDVI